VIARENEHLLQEAACIDDNPFMVPALYESDYLLIMFAVFKPNARGKFYHLAKLLLQFISLMITGCDRQGKKSIANDSL
jgi:hypothetical protein